MEPFVTGDDTTSLKPIASFAGTWRKAPALADNATSSFAARSREEELAHKTLSEDKWASASAGRLLLYPALLLAGSQWNPRPIGSRWGREARGGVSVAVLEVSLQHFVDLVERFFLLIFSTDSILTREPSARTAGVLVQFLPHPSLPLCPWATHFTHIAKYK